MKLYHNLQSATIDYGRGLQSEDAPFTLKRDNHQHHTTHQPGQAVLDAQLGCSQRRRVHGIVDKTY